MSERQIIEVDPWLHKNLGGRRFLESLQFLCCYEVAMEIHQLTEALFLRRTSEHDELWSLWHPVPHLLEALKNGKLLASIPNLGPIDPGCCVIASTSLDEASAGRDLFDVLCRSRVGFGWPIRFEVAGLIDEETYQGVLDEIRAERENYEEQARAEEGSEIVVAANELGLNPNPAGTGPHFWQANCPGNEHFIEVHSERDEFFCGYCRRKGGVAELRAFVEESRGDWDDDEEEESDD